MLQRSLALAFVSTLTLLAQDPMAAARQWRMEHQKAILDSYTSLLSIPNVAADPKGLRQTADTLVEQLHRRNVETQLLSIAGVPPVVFGERKVPGATQTVVFYAH